MAKGFGASTVGRSSPAVAGPSEPGQGEQRETGDDGA